MNYVGLSLLSSIKSTMITPEELDEYGRNIFLYHGLITRDGYKQLSDLIDAKEHKHEDVCLILSTVLMVL